MNSVFFQSLRFHYSEYKGTVNSSRQSSTHVNFFSLIKNLIFSDFKNFIFGKIFFSSIYHEVITLFQHIHQENVYILYQQYKSKCLYLHIWTFLWGRKHLNLHKVKSLLYFPESKYFCQFLQIGVLAGITLVGGETADGVARVRARCELGLFLCSVAVTALSTVGSGPRVLEQQP